MLVSKSAHYERELIDKVVDLIFSLEETCVLDVADKGGLPLHHVGKLMGIGRERVRQVEGLKGEGLKIKKRKFRKIAKEVLI